jgi:hypothetical protein
MVIHIKITAMIGGMIAGAELWERFNFSRNTHPTKRPAARKRPGVQVKFGKMTESVGFRLPDATNGTEAFLEFVDAAFGIHELGESGEERMGIRSDTDRDEAVFHAIDDFLFLGSLGRTADEAFAGGHVYEDDRIVFRMQVLFHGNRLATTLPTRRSAENGQKTRAVKQASTEISNIL